MNAFFPLRKFGDRQWRAGKSGPRRKRTFAKLASVGLNPTACERSMNSHGTTTRYYGFDSGAEACGAQQEDNATLTALKRADFRRVALLRTASNFDREAPRARRSRWRPNWAAASPSVANAYRVGGALAHAIVADWDTWSRGPPQ